MGTTKDARWQAGEELNSHRALTIATRAPDGLALKLAIARAYDAWLAASLAQRLRPGSSFRRCRGPRP